MLKFMIWGQKYGMKILTFPIKENDVFKRSNVLRDRETMFFFFFFLIYIIFIEIYHLQSSYYFIDNIIYRLK